MTSSDFMFGSPQVAAPVDQAGEAKSRQKLMIVVAAVVALAAAAYFVVLPMFSKSTDKVAFAPKKGIPSAAKKAAAKKAAAKKAVKKPAAKKPAPADVPSTFNDAVSRDPFHALYVTPVVAPPATTPATAPGSGSTDTGSGTAPSSSTVGSTHVSLLHVYAKDGKNFAQTKVDDTVYSPAQGDVFGNNFKLLSVSGTCGNYLFGDEPFTLCEGQEVLK